MILLVASVKEVFLRVLPRGDFVSPGNGR